MRQGLVLFRKELLEAWRASRWLWVPLVFAVLGAMQPLAAHFMPEILDTFGGLPAGTVIEIPPPTPAEAAASALNQLGTIGLLVLVLVGMAAVAGERASGTAAFVLVKPVSRAAYLLAKWTAHVLLMLVALGVGQAAAWYYTDLLIGPLAVPSLLGATAVFAVWLAFIIAAEIALGVWLRSTAGVVGATLGGAIVLAALAALPGSAMAWNPARLPAHAAALLGGEGSGLALPLAVTLAATAAMLAAAIAALRRRPVAA